MQYLGGKSRISREISEVINEVSRWKIKDSARVITNNIEIQRGGGREGL